MDSRLLLVVRRGAVLLGAAAALSSAAAGCMGSGEPAPEGIVALSATSEPAGPVLEAAMEPKEGGPKIGAVEMVAPIFLKPDRRSPKIGYLRAGGTLNHRNPRPAPAMAAQMMVSSPAPGTAGICRYWANTA